MSDPTELELLKQRADTMGITYSGNIGVKALADKISTQINGEEEQPEPEADIVAAPVAPKPAAKATVQGTVKALALFEPCLPVEGETVVQRKQRIRLHATRKVRVVVTCMNPEKKSWEGEYITVGNRLVGTIREFVPFNNEEGWHVSQMVLNLLNDRKCQIFVKNKRRGGMSGAGDSSAKRIKEFQIIELPALTKADLKELAAAQAAAHNID